MVESVWAPHTTTLPSSMATEGISPGVHDEWCCNEGLSDSIIFLWGWGGGSEGRGLRTTNLAFWKFNRKCSLQKYINSKDAGTIFSSEWVSKSTGFVKEGFQTSFIIYKIRFLSVKSNQTSACKRKPGYRLSFHLNSILYFADRV